MISSPTVLILGAGASVPYGFPSGMGLVASAVEALRAETHGFFRLQEAGFTTTDIESFRFSLSRSGRSSIDAFLEHRPEFLAVGKAAIAALLLPGEIEDELFALNNRGSWYGYFFQQLNAGFDEFAENRIAIVTFNYDRSLEYYLWTALKHSYGKSDAEVTAVINRLPLIHVYGQLGPLPQLGPAGVGYGTSPDDPDALRSAAAGIRIIHEGVHTDDVLRRAQGYIEAATRVCFLGFGYHAMNLERLGMPKSCAKARVWGSTAAKGCQPLRKWQSCSYLRHRCGSQPSGGCRGRRAAAGSGSWPPVVSRPGCRGAAS